MPEKLPSPNWSYNRRLALSRELSNVIYRLFSTPSAKSRDFYTEAKAVLPDLHAEIERFNKRQRDAANRKKPKVDSHVIRQSACQVAMFGSEKQCEDLVKKYLKI